jgi:thioredoxin-like negative regulator of GroEL
VIELLLEAERAMEMGRIDAAEALYRQVIDSDPRNGIAVVGLARVTLERGDELGAYQAAQRALAIDPENSAAQRMVARLAEVLAYRGEPVPEPEPTTEAATVAPADDTAVPPTDRRSLLDRGLRKR